MSHVSVFTLGGKTAAPHTNLHPVMYDLSQLTCISGSLHAWGRAAAGILWWFARLRLNVKVQTLSHITHVTLRGSLPFIFKHERFSIDSSYCMQAPRQAVLTIVTANETQRWHHIIASNLKICPQTPKINCEYIKIPIYHWQPASVWHVA